MVKGSWLMAQGSPAVAPRPPPGDYLDQFWSNKILVLLCEGPKPPNSMIYWFLSPGEPVFMHLDIPKYFKTYKKYRHNFEKYYFCKSDNLFSLKTQNMFWKLCVPTVCGCFLLLFSFSLCFSNFMGRRFFIEFGKDGHRNMMNIG